MDPVFWFMGRHCLDGQRGRLLKESIQISMDGKGRAIDNVMVERLWRSVKYDFANRFQ